VGNEARLINSSSNLKKINAAECDLDFARAQKCVIFVDIESLPILEYSRETMTPTK
jgi:hypothetical protein